MSSCSLMVEILSRIAALRCYRRKRGMLVASDPVRPGRVGDTGKGRASFHYILKYTIKDYPSTFLRGSGKPKQRTGGLPSCRPPGSGEWDSFVQVWAQGSQKNR